MKGGNRRDHTVGGASLSIDAGGRGFSVRCRCGWVSETYPSPVMAAAAGEQHTELRTGRFQRWK